MDEQEALSHLIGQIYDASLDQQLWPTVLKRTCGYVEGVAAVLVSHEASAKTGQFYFSWGDDPAYTDAYNSTYVKINPLLIAIFVHAKQGDIVSIGDVMPYEEYFESRFYKEWASPQGYLDAIHAVLEKSASAYASV